jgi:acyl carrier protein
VNDDRAPISRSPSSNDVREWLRAHVARILKCAPEDVDVNAPVDRLGLDSATAVGLTLDLEDWLGRPVEPAVFYDYGTIQALADALGTRGAGTSDDQNPL